jgi:hypothetical protein
VSLFRTGILALALALSFGGAPSASAFDFCRLFLSPFVSAEKRVDRLIAEGHHQEAIWMLEEEGRTEEARELKAKVLALMRDGKELERTEVGGANNFGRVRLSTGISGIFKSGGSYSWHQGGSFSSFEAYHELLAFELNEFLGYQLVPLTIWRRNQFEHEYFVPPSGTFQLWVGRARTDSYHKWLRPRQNEVRFFKYLAGSTDHHSGNVLKLPTGKRLAIDYGISYPQMIRFDHPLRYLVPGDDMLARLRNTSDDALRSHLLRRFAEADTGVDAKYLAAMIDGVVARKNKLVERIDEYLAADPAKRKLLDAEDVR